MKLKELEFLSFEINFFENNIKLSFHGALKNNTMFDISWETYIANTNGMFKNYINHILIL